MSEGAAAGGAGASGGGQPGAGGQPAPQGGSPADWRTGFEGDLKGYVENKGWKSPVELAESYRNLEKHFGVPQEQLMRLPSKDDDAEGWGKVYSRLGRPEKADDYKIDVPQGESDEFAKWAKGAFHELGLSKKQAEKLSSKWNEYHQGVASKASEAQQAKLNEEAAGLKKEWGAAFDQNTNIAKRAVATFGMNADMIDKLEGALGFSGVMKLFHSLGSKTGEAQFVSGDSRNPGFGGVLSPEAARNRINSLRGDPDFVRRYAGGDLSTKEEMERLHKWAYPDSN